MAAEWMTPDELAHLTGLSEKSLANLRAERRRFPFYRIEGSRRPVYRRDEIDRLLNQARVEVRQ